jgi:hypothetical protein
MKQITRTLGFHLTMFFALGLHLAFSAASRAQDKISATAVVPDTIPEPKRSELNKAREPIEFRRALLRERAAEHNAKCKSAPEGPAAKQLCRDRQQNFKNDVADLVRWINDFNEDVRVELVIPAMNALAEKLQWTAKERARLDKALNALNFDGNNAKNFDEINQVWKDMVGRGESFAAEAGKGKGPGMPGAGQQTAYQDCVVFALANASGQPYGVVAARVTKLMSEGEWRDRTEQADPQAVIEKRGLIGGEVVMMAEALGQVEVVNSNAFAKTLEGGRTVMVNVFPHGGGSHEVVLTKTFQHDGDTWFEMMDSNQGPIRRLYLRHQDLMSILKENGVAYSRDPGNTPRLLH